MTENWHGIVTITAGLVLDYEFGDDFPAKNGIEAMENGLEMFCENIMYLAYMDPDDLRRWIREVAQATVESRK